jgi:phytoene dehydrogenase-like protein
MNRTNRQSQPVEDDHADVIVVGAGLAGLTAAALVARAGRSVIVVEQGRNPGGRATTNVVDGVSFNLGAHALCAREHACRVLRELAVPFSGHFPSPGRPLVTLAGKAFRLPAGLGSLATSRLLSVGEKLRFARLFVTIKGLDTRQLDRVSAREWINRTAGRGNLAALLAALFRVSTYVDDAERLSAGVALDQLRSALIGNVLYIDGGWQTLVDGLRRVAADRCAEIRTNARATSIETGACGTIVHLANGDALRGRATILAVAPQEACELLNLPKDAPLARWTARQAAVQAACLDIALSQLPRAGDRFALALDQPTYFSVHSAAAKLGPEGVVVLHLMKYLRGDADESIAGAEAELETFLDLVQPGWQAHIVARRFLPRMTVCPALPRADEGGLSGRPGVLLDDRAKVFLAGDWIGLAGTLADAAAASAEQAARRALDSLGTGATPVTIAAQRESVLDVRR